MGTPNTTPSRKSRGEWFVAGQLLLIALLLLGPRTLPGWPSVPPFSILIVAIPGAALVLAGVTLLIAGGLKLGRSLTALPYPSEHGALVQTGPYRLVRHPMYSGGILFAYGWALLVHGPLTAVYATIILVFLDIKSRREERWLRERYPDYAAYQRRVKKLIPSIY